MKDYFPWFLEDTFTHTQSIFNWEKENRPARFAQKVLNPGPKAIEVNSAGWIAGAGTATLRYARFQSPIIDIATVLLCPTASPDLIPVFAAEWVAVMDNLHVIVLDVEELPDNQGEAAGLAELKSRWSAEFPTQPDLPGWFAEIASPHAIFSKGKVHQIENVRTMFNEYLASTCEHFFIPQRHKIGSGPDHPLVQSYKRHHAEHSPARAIVKEENKGWLEEFLLQYHFGTIEP